MVLPIAVTAATSHNPPMKSLHLLLSLPVRLEQVVESAGKAAPSLMAICRRGTLSREVPSLLETCCQAFGIERQQDWPIAPLTALSDGLEPKNHYWLRLDPAHLEVGMGGLILRPAKELALSASEVLALIGSINSHLREQGLEILAPTPTRWYLRLSRPPEFVSTPLDQVVGEYMTPHLPRGGDANRLMSMVNEAQMLMHEHAVNLSREAEGHPAVNGLWLWGGGVMPRPAPKVERVASDDAEVIALARAVGIQMDPGPGRLRDMGDPSRSMNTLVTLSPGLEDFGLEDYLAKLERDWFRPLLRGLAFGRIRRLRFGLMASTGRSFSIDTAQAWRFWR